MNRCNHRRLRDAAAAEAGEKGIGRMAKRNKNEISELEISGRLRNRLLAASTLQVELRRAAKRVMRLSAAGTPERLFTLSEVANESSLSAGAIVDEIIRLNRVAAIREQEEGNAG